MKQQCMVLVTALLVKNDGARTTGGLFLYKSFIHVLQYYDSQK